MKKYATLILITVSVFLCFLLSAAAPKETEYTYRVVLPDTSIYAEANFDSEVVGKLPQNAVVEKTGEPVTIGDVVWLPIKYTSISGYVVEKSLYKSLKNDNFEVTLAKFITQKMGKDIDLYGTHSVESEVIATAHDGEKVHIVRDNLDYGDFYYVEFNGNYYFALKENVTTGLSYNQKLAVIISSCAVGVTIIAVIVVLIVRKRKMAE